MKRVLLVHRGNWSSVHPVVAAMALGQVDYHLYVPWAPLERILYPADQRLPGGLGHDAGGRRWCRCGSSARNGRRGRTTSATSWPARPSRTGSTTPASAEGRRLLEETGRDGSRLPVVAHFAGAVLEDPTDAELVARSA